MPIKALADGNTGRVITFEQQIKIASNFKKYQLYHNLLLETNFGIKFYLEAPYWKKLDSEKKNYKIL